MRKITRRTFMAETATIAAGKSALAAKSIANPPQTAAATESMARRRETLKVLLKILPRRRVELTGRINAYDKSWEDWLQRTGELPPDLTPCRPQPFLVDPLEGVRTAGAMGVKRQQIRAQFERWVFGKNAARAGQPSRCDHRERRPTAS